MIRVLIADDQQLFRELLVHMLEGSKDIEVAGVAMDAKEARELAASCNPDVILMDVLMPEGGGIEAIRRIRSDGSGAKILVLSAKAGEEAVKEALAEGADGYVLKTIGRNELVLAVRSILTGMEIVQSDAVRSLSVREVKRPSGRKNGVIVQVNHFDVELTERDMEIIQMIVDGRSTEEIARNYSLVEGRVRNIISELISKMMLRDRTQLAIFALKNHLAI